MKTRLILLIVLLFLFTLLTTGCLTIDINIGIDRDNTSYLTYNIKLDASDIEPQYHSVLSNALNRLGWHYQEELGFTVGLDTDSEIFLLVMSKRVSNNSFSQAYRSLEAILTDENMTAFMKVDMSNQSLPRQELFYLSAMLDIPQVLKLSSAEDLPPELLTEFEDAVIASDGTITLTFPVSEIIKNSHAVSSQRFRSEMKVPLSYSDQTEFEFAASLIYMDDGTIGESFDDISEQLLKMRNIALIACAAAALILLIALIAIFVRR